MALRILVRETPHRSLALVTDTHTLVFRHNAAPHAAGHAAQPQAPRCMVDFSNKSVADLQEYKPLRTLPVYGTLGVVNIGKDIFLCVITGASHVAQVRPHENVQKIVSVEFYSLNRADFDQISPSQSHQYDYDDFTLEAHELSSRLDHNEPAPEHPCSDLQKVLGDGTFYYSTDFDLTNNLQIRSSKESTFEVESFDEAFLWNSYMVAPLIEFRSRLGPADREALDLSRILTSAIRGYAAALVIPASASPIQSIETTAPSAMTVISRLSKNRAGTRFNSRGIDDEGNVSNWVETETVYWHPSGLCFSYTQVRGSVPVFWEQTTGLLPQQQKIQITRSPEATQPAFNRHFDDMELKYGSVHILNLLSETKQGEVDLSTRYRYHVGQCPLNERSSATSQDHAMLKTTHFDFHAETKGTQGYEAASSIRNLIRDTAEGFTYCLLDVVTERSRSGEISMRSVTILQQQGIFRTNCLDCLDRTNLIQTIVSQLALESFLRHRGESAYSDFYLRHSTLWADNGDALSKIYAGTGALKSSFTRHGKMSLSGALADARKSATRLYINNFTDKARQTVIDTLLGRLVDQSPVQIYDPINDYVNSELIRRAGEYSSTDIINIWVGTFNVNGKDHGINENLSAWLWPPKIGRQNTPDIFAVGFQEMVELSPQQIMSTDPARRQDWEDAVKKCLNGKIQGKGGDEYVLLRSGQLVGAALIIFVKATILSSIKNVEGSVKKTGMSGMAGNKGAVAIRMEISNTRLCFVTAHLAAGFSNYDERNRDYATINHGLRFQRNRSIDDHDRIVWMGDFNYRIGLNREKADELIQSQDLHTLYRNDQLNLQMSARHARAFLYYQEGAITFMPTYKFDVGTHEYDTSEKQRIPAWCDRVLFKGEGLKQLTYQSVPLVFSDHRPVYAIFECAVDVIDEAAKAEMMKNIYGRRRSEIGSVIDGEDLDEEEAMGFESIGAGLPPPSSSRQKWWLAHGMPARSQIAETNSGYIPNPSRTSNPFTPSEESDWILVSGRGSPNDNKGYQRGETATSGGTLPNSPPRLSNHTSIAKVGLASGGPLTSSSPAPELRRKPAPPVPKKPLLFSSIAPEQMYQSSQESPETPSTIGRLSSISRDATDTYFPPPPKSSTNSHQSSVSRQLPALERRLPPVEKLAPERRPALPERPGVRKPPVDILTGDDENHYGDAKEIPSLQPMRRQ